MAPLLRLLQLLWIAQQDKAAPSRCAGQHIRQRHLAGLVDKEDVDRPHEFLARPEPRSASEHVYGAALQVVQGVVIRPDLANRPVGGTIALSLVSAGYPSNIHLLRSSHDV